MTPQQIVMVQETWQLVVPIRDTAAALFYGKLFELDPALKPLFKGDMVAQGDKLTSMINSVVTQLHRLEEVVPAIKNLGRRHVRYGVKDDDYDTVGAALIWTLGAGLGEAFTPAVSEAWALAYATLAGAMKTAAAEAEV